MITTPTAPSDSAAPDDGAPEVTTSTALSGTTHIRSFVHRRAHITPGQREALDRLMPQWSIPYRPSILDFEKAFGREAPTILEIGFGMGETTQKIAEARPDDNFLGVEVFNAGVGALLKRIEESGQTNIRIIQHDAVEVARDM
ncbi:MAG: tRNA (guanosine(46)-N7)-methyltransferase TrmB, partial [Candidimonas sp.]|nr:tRNA (guanosine(46)-N7)-methyltransferase TrmB [Candidimonas sp.]